jgi:hypothetical protein
VDRRNNQERLGAPHPDSATPPNPQTNSEDIFSFVVPTEFIDLPSKGAFYGEGHPLEGINSIEIRHMTAKEEDILTSESLLRKGVAIERLLSALLVDKTIKLEDLLVGDKNALVVGSRITGYGSLYETRVICPACTEKQQMEFDLHNLTVRGSTLPEGVTHGSGTTFFLQLPQAELQVEIGLLSGKEEKNFLASSERKKKQKLPNSASTDLLKLLIRSVEGHTDAKTINQLVNVLPISDARYIKEVYEAVSPDIDLTHDFICSSCDHDGRIAVPLTADFFWPER